ncbi:hypothetical protein HPB49_024787 [Dermacentor silvarum]|uniref:Uncharacterized protein n=1 Tax=Dermacentor silvarum TaxID=543639 RepID=A0ACB8C623_DERSI|nr:hypothetical protein HPB49_024787 [Dermacentor silvarum]
MRFNNLSTATAGVSPPASGALLRRRQQAQPIFHIGAVVNPPDSTSYFAQAIEDAVAEHGITLYAQTVHMNSNPIRIAQSVCENLISSQLERVIEYEPGITDITQELEETKEIHCRVFVLYATAEDATGIYSEVAFLNMTSPGYVWIVSEQALRAPNVPDGVLGLELVNASDERAHIRDSVQVIALALKELQKDPNMTQPNISCSMLGNSWESGLKLVSLLKKQKLLRGETGRVRFDDKGDRLDSDYDILNVVRGSHVPVGQYVFSKWAMSMELELELEKMVWPGRQTETPLGYVIPKHLHVATIAERPFVWVRPVADESQCLPSEILCPWTNSTDGTAYPYCCEGYCMDLLRSLAHKLNFTYTLYQVQDGQYGTFDFVKSAYRRIFVRTVHKLCRPQIESIDTAAPEQKSMEIDFTKPFKYQGITILAKKQDKSSTLASFLQPFQKTLWILVMVSVHVVALALYLLDRFSPFGRYKLPNSDATEEDALNLSSAIWFAWGVLLNSGIAEGTPRSFSGRVLGMVWAGFAMIVVASYTANLAAFLVLEKPESSAFRSFSFALLAFQLRNPSENFTYATVKGSAVDMYFRRQVELSNMYRIMEGKNYETVEEGIEALKNNQLDAFIWDSSRLEFEAAQHCDLVTAGEQFGRSGYGIGLQRNSFWVDKVTLTLLEMHESGYMEQLDSKWIIRDGEKCETKNERTPATLGLTNMAGVFILVGAGIVGGIGLIVIEIVYKKHQTRKQRRLELARHAADKWRGAVEHWEDWDPEAYYDLSPRPNRQGDKEKLAEPPQPQLQPLSHMWKNLDVLAATRTRTVGTNTEPSFLEIPGSKAKRRRRRRPARERSSSRDLSQSSSRDTDSSGDNAVNSRPAAVKQKHKASPVLMVH